ncbi:MAG TPA: 16S rRNA (cytosine(1402)-N(4))-methyltransferase [Sulfobacillus sp.]|nr:16S rRNA (cytosine(1402)-N(4))-methyltransferase [Sulfobacillus sp.]
MTYSHVSVLSKEALEYWVQDQEGVYIDATVGGGGHSLQLLSQYPHVCLIAFDQDPVAIDAAKERLGAFSNRITWIRANFRDMDQKIDPSLHGHIAGIFFDLGVSSPQFDDSSRGFTYQADATLDMRMDPSNPLTAFRLVNMRSKEEITHALREWGEERWARRIADFIVKAREREPIRTTGQLVELIKAAIPASARRTGGHPARRTFQALRIWVNDELGALNQGLEASQHLIAPKGRVVVISFHSLEDRIVKHVFRQWAQEQKGHIATKHPLTPSDEEVLENPRSRSAKMRVFEHF